MQKSSQYKGQGNPVDNVSWDDCQEFIKKLNVTVGAGFAPPSGAPQAAPVRFSLPTEAQWEYACRAGTDTKWFWGDDETRIWEYANTSEVVVWRFWRWQVVHEDGFAQLAPVGRLRPNRFRLYDMAGNVLEWCQDWYGRYAVGEVVDPTGSKDGADRVARSGPWDIGPNDCRSASRYLSPSDCRDTAYGCRLVLLLR
jgi:formylglycine-generating enzyme required for sulfatase activity